MLCAANNIPASFTTPSGWALKESATNIGSTGVGAAFVWTTLATGSETGSLTVTCASANNLAGTILRYTAASGFGDTASAASSSLSTASPTAGTLSPVPGASDMVVRIYCWADNGTGAGSTLTNPGGTWTTRLNLVTQQGGDATGLFNCGFVAADKIAGTDNQTVTSSVTGAFFVVDVAITASAASPRPLAIRSQAVMRASNW